MAILTPDFLDTKTYPAARLRQALDDAFLQEGAYGVTAFRVLQRGAGANMSVDIQQGAAWVQGDNVLNQGLYHVLNDADFGGTVIPASHATLPRIDQVLLRVRDSVAGGGADLADIFVNPGTATAGATLDNRTGAAALPATCMRLADILVPAGSTSVVTANIRDRRPWCRGAFAGGDSSLGATTVATTVNAWTTPPGMGPFRVELSGGPVTLQVQGILNASQPASVAFNAWVNGAEYEGTAKGYGTIAVANKAHHIPKTAEILTFAAGSYLIDPKYYIDTTGTCNITGPLRAVLREFPQSAGGRSIQ